MKKNNDRLTASARRKKLAPRCFMVAGLTTFFAVSTLASAQGIAFNDALSAALQRSPQLQARSASVQGAQALQTSAAQLPDPKLTLGIDSLPVTGPNRGSLTRDDFTQRQIGWMQDVPNRAKRAARADAALARTAREQALLEMEKLTVRREAGLAWLASFFAEKRLALFDELITRQKLLQSTAPAQVAAGKINPAEVATVGMDTLVLEDRRDELRREADQAGITLRRWVGDTDGKTPVVDLATPLPVMALDRAYLLANIERNPEIATLVPMQAMASASVREAEAAKRGDWSWAVSYGKRGQGYGDLASVLLTFELPLSPAQRQQPQIRAGQKEVERITAEHDELVRKQTQELENLLSELSEIDSKINRISGQAQPFAAQRTALLLAAYESGRDKLGSVLESRKQQTELSLRALELQARQRAVLWRLNSIVPEPTP